MGSTKRLPPPTTLNELCNYLDAGLQWDGAPLNHGQIDMTSLPTFGGPRPRDTAGIWSWNRTHFLVERSDGFRVIPRSEISTHAIRVSR
jgi:hypothetical protein